MTRLTALKVLNSGVRLVLRFLENKHIKDHNKTNVSQF